VAQGGGGCRWCASGGLKSAEPAIVYLITHSGCSAAKIGITDADGRRLIQHQRRGWETLATIEKEVLDWWRGELALRADLGREEMPQGGWTETVDLTEIDVAATMLRVQSLARSGMLPRSSPTAGRDTTMHN
jgi:hypothetical protein